MPLCLLLDIFRMIAGPSRGCRDGGRGQIGRITGRGQGVERKIQLHATARFPVTEIRGLRKGPPLLGSHKNWLPLLPPGNPGVVNEVLSWRLPNHRPVIRR